MNADMDRFRRTLEDGVSGELEGYVDNITKSIVATVWNACDDERGRLRAEVEELRTQLATAERQAAELGQRLTDIRHLHTDSPMGPCPVCIDGDAQAAGGDGLISYPCPTARLAGATDCEPKQATS